MRVLLDTCVWGGVRNALSDAGHDVIWVGDWPCDPGILRRALVDARVLVTRDKDFGEPPHAPPRYRAPRLSVDLAPGRDVPRRGVRARHTRTDPSVARTAGLRLIGDAVANHVSAP